MAASRQSPPNSSGWEVEEEEDDHVSRSCLALRFGNRSKTPVQARGVTSTPRRGDTSTVSKSAKPTYQSSASLISSNSNHNVAQSAKISRDPESPIDRLLAHPVPEDRRQRAVYESQKRLKGVYEGEMEPEGHRGQEMSLPVAKQVSPKSSASPLVLRSFESPAPFSARVSQSDTRKPPIRIVLPDDPPAGETQSQLRGNANADYVVPQSARMITTLEPASNDKAEQMNRRLPQSGLPVVTPDRLPQFTPSLRASKASSPVNSSDEIVIDEMNDGYSSTSSVSLKQLQEDFLRDIPSDEDEEVSEKGASPREVLYGGVPWSSRERSLPAAATPNTPTTAATSSVISVTSSNLNLSATHSSASVTTTSAERNVNSLHALAMERVHSGDLESAVTMLETIVNLQTHLHGKVSPQVASAQHNLGTVHAKRAQLLGEGTLAQAHERARALQCFQTAARTARDSLGRYHGNVAVSLVRMGFLLLQARHYQNAIVVFEEALRIRLSVYGTRHLLVANLYNNLGVCYMHLGEFAKGKEFLVAALDIQRDLTSDNIHQLELADTLFNIGGLCLEWIRRQGPDSRRADEAEEAFAEAYQIRRSILGEKDPMTTQVRSLLEMAKAVPRPSLSRSPKRLRDKRSATGIASRGERERDAAVFRAPTSSSLRNGLQHATHPSTASNTISTSRHRSAPVSEVSVSTDDAKPNGGTRIFMAPHLVPASPTRREASDDAVNLSLGESFTPDVSFADVAPRSSAPVPKSLSYDAEENCLISESGVNSEHGKIHYPLSWTKAGIEASVGSGSPSRDLVVTRPFRRQENRVGTRTVTYSVASQPGSTFSSNAWGSETVNFSTGNKERDDVMSRAKAILDAHGDDMDTGGLGSSSLAENEIADDADLDDSRDANIVQSLSESLCQEDGIAPLGGDWPRDEASRRYSRELLLDPMNHLPIIQSEATRRLSEGDALDALPLFETILECQRRRNGQLHPDVASALHNVGITYLRAQSHSEALKAFEEAARIRKGALGREHPQVAESLVKVGITLLLLHRFDDALWSFREALAVRRHSMGSLHPSVARIYNNIGCVHVEFNEYREARRAFEAALDVQRSALAQDPESGPVLFATATTLCNLGYLYRFRDMHSKATTVLREAADLQERVLGRHHSTVLSTLDTLADSCANSGQASDALRYYGTVLERFRAVTRSSSSGERNKRSNRAGENSAMRAEAVLLYKMSRVHRQRNDRESQLSSLKLALRAVRAAHQESAGFDPNTPHHHPAAAAGYDPLERRIQYDIRSCREQLEKEELEWV